MCLRDETYTYIRINEYKPTRTYTPPFSHYYLPAFRASVSVMNDLLCRWMLFRAARWKKRQREREREKRGMHSRLRVGGEDWKRDRRSECMRVAGMEKVWKRHSLMDSRTPLLSPYCRLRLSFPLSSYTPGLFPARRFLATHGAKKGWGRKGKQGRIARYTLKSWKLRNTLRFATHTWQDKRSDNSWQAIDLNAGYGRANYSAVYSTLAVYNNEGIISAARKSRWGFPRWFPGARVNSRLVD